MSDWEALKIIDRFFTRLGLVFAVSFFFAFAPMAFADELVEESEEVYETVVESSEIDGSSVALDESVEAVLGDYNARLSAVEEVVEPLANYEAYDGSISTTYTTYFAGLVEKLGPGVDYVLFRNGQYNYTFVYGDLDINGTTISGQGVQAVYINSYGTTSVSYGTESSFSAELGNRMAYSSLGDYPVLQQGVRSYENKALIVAVAVFFLYVVCRDMFKSVRGFGR